MSILAIIGVAFSAAIFAGNFLISEQGWLVAAAVLILVAAGAFLARKRRKTAMGVLLVCAAAAVGFLWLAVYTQIFVQPARALDGETVRLTATVADYPQEGEFGYTVLVHAQTDAGIKVRTILYVDEQGAQLKVGDRIAAVTHCTLGDRTFSGEEITFYTAKGIFMRGKTYGKLEIDSPAHIPLRHWAAVSAKALKDGISAAFPPRSAALVRALVTGNRDQLTDEYTTSLQRTGLSHTVAVSGMHLAFLASMISLVFGKGKRRTAVVTAVIVVIFCGIVGNTPSVLRAAVMIILLQLAPMLGRQRDDITALVMALMLLLAQNPYCAAHVGLQLSFAAVLGIMLVSDSIQSYLLERLKLNRRKTSVLSQIVQAVPRFAVSTLSATLGASVFTVPLTAVHFQSVSLLAPLSNLLTLWAVAALFSGGLVVGTIGVVAPAAAGVMAIPFTLISDYLTCVTQALGRLPLAAISLHSFYYRAWVVLLCLLLLELLLQKGRRRWVFPFCSAVIALCCALVFTHLSFQAGEMSVAILDAGQGQSVLLRAGNYLTLMDCGGDKKTNAGDIVSDYLQSMGLDRLDLLMLSHYHADHANGIPQLLRRVKVDAIALPDVEPEDKLRQEILTLAQEKEIEVWFIREDTHVYLGEEQEFTIFAPLGTGSSTNELGLTLLATAGDFDVLITGDMGDTVERLLLAHTQLPDLELLVVGHHGSKYSTTQELLQAGMPDIAVISVGANNRYGHPTQETLDRLEEIGAEIYRTDEQGTILINANAA